MKITTLNRTVAGNAMQSGAEAWMSETRIKQVAIRTVLSVATATAAMLLRDAGFRDVGVLRGGMEQWNHKGLPIEGHAGLEHT